MRRPPAEDLPNFAENDFARLPDTQDETYATLRLRIADSFLSGAGTLHLRSGTPITCSFEAGQFANGDVLVLSHTSADVWEDDAAIAFTGQTTAGWSINADLDTPITVLGKGIQLPAGTYFAHRATRLRAITAVGQGTTHRYGIVNFRFFGTEAFTACDAAGQPVLHGRRLGLQLLDPRGSISVHLEPVADYSHVAQDISTTRGVAVSCEAVVQVAALPINVDPDDVISDLCLLLSLARGTNVQWLYRRDVCGSGEVSMAHISHITRRFQGMGPLDHRAPRREDTKRFLEAAYAALPDVARTYEVRRGLIMAYIDARSEEDFLEMRGVKLAIVAEMIKAQHGGAGSTSSIAGRWRRLMSRVVSRWRRPMHPRFTAALRAACRDAGFSPSRSDTRDFVSSRNRLVHVGRFRADPAVPQLPCRFSSPAMEDTSSW